MILTLFWCLSILISTIFACVRGSTNLGTAFSQGAVDAVRLCVSISGPLALWSGMGKLLERLGVTYRLSRLLEPVYGVIFPGSRDNRLLSQALSGNICANLLGLGNAATPLGIRAVKLMKNPLRPEIATDEMCRFVVMNTASIQLLPTTVATLRHSAGCTTPFDILPCVWVSSILSVSAGLASAWLLGRFWSTGED